MSIAEIFALALNAILVENFVLVKLPGCGPFLRSSESMGAAAKTGLAVTAVTAVVSAFTWAANRLVLAPLGAEYLQTAVFVLIIAAVVLAADKLMGKFAPTFRRDMGISLPLVITNCAVLGAALISARGGYGIVGSVVYGASAGLGFTLAAVLLASVRERLEFSECPKCFEGFPIALVTAALLSMAFMGFHGMKIF